MCKFLSAVFLKSGAVLCAPEHTDSHEDLLAASNVNDGEASYFAGNICRVEFTPPEDFTKVSDLSLWQLHVDEKEKPDWFDEANARENLEGRVRRMIVTDARGTLLGGCWILEGVSASVSKLVHGRIAGIANGASLDGASLIRASLDGASLDGARLDRASLDGASLNGASLDRARLNGASLDGASLDRARLNGASLDGASLNGASLDDAVGLRLPPGWKLVDGIARRTP